MLLCKNQYRLEKISGSLAVIMTTCAILIAYLQPAMSYELSIYESTSIVVWILILISTLIALALVFIPIVLKNKESRYWFIGLLILLLNRITIQWIPFIRGYFTLSGDQMTNIGHIIDILNYGHFNQNNFYPITHIINSQVIIITDIQPILFSNLSTAIMSSLYLISLYIIIKCIFNNSTIGILATVSATAVLFSGYDLFLMPNGWSIFIIPIIFYVFLKSRIISKMEWRVVLIVFLLTMPFFHPLSSIMMIILLFTSGFVEFIVRVVQSNNHNILKNNNSMPFTSIFIITIALFVWILSFRLFESNVLNIYTAITSGAGPEFLDELNSAASKLNLGGTQLVFFIIKIIGHNIIFLLISIIGFIYYIFYKYYKDEKNAILITFFSITGIFGILYISYIFNLIPGLDALGGGRALAYAIIFTPILVGWAMNISTTKIRFKKFIAISFTLLIFSASLLSVLSIYPSPYTEGPNAQITKSDVSISSWILTKKCDTIYTSSILSPIDRYSHLILGLNEGGKNPVGSTIPDHFGYEENTKLNLTLGEERYIVLNPIDKIVYTTVWASVGRFNERDFQMLNFDSSVDKIYSNEKGEIWMVH